jgi:hypothetical protein
VLKYFGKFVLVRRGDCTFEQKAVSLNSFGASAMIVGNSDGGVVHMPGTIHLSYREHWWHIHQSELPSVIPHPLAWQGHKSLILILPV